MGRPLHYLDDFLLGGKRGKNHCEIIMTDFQACMSNLGIPIAGEKTKGPTTVLFIGGGGGGWGLELDSDEVVVRLPIDKIDDIIQKIEDA